MLLAGCAPKKNLTAKSSLSDADSHYVVKDNQNDTYMIIALDAAYRSDHETSAIYFTKLYQSTKDQFYAHEAIASLIKLKKYDQIKELLDEALTDHPNSTTLKRFLAAYYIDTKNNKMAKKTLLDIQKETKSDEDMLLFAHMSVQMGEVNNAIKIYEKIYEKKKTKETLLPLVDALYYKSENKNQALKLLNTHINFVNCDETLCIKLIELYRQENKINDIITLTKKLYKKTKKQKYAKMLLTLYKYNKDYDKAIKFLKKSHFNDKDLLDIYLANKSYKDALSLANILYKDSGDLNYLAQIAMIEYENAKIKDKKLLKMVSKKFNKVVKNLDNPTYNNFYGYILIDHNFDIEKGITLVKKALKIKPNAPYFIDSLAWGYYKQNKCQKAFDTLYPIDAIIDEPEIKKHLRKIEKCLIGK